MLALLPMHPVQLIWAPARAIRWHFPSVSLQPLPLGSPFTSAVCQCDGYYEPTLTLRRLSPASWQAVAIRVAQRLPTSGAVVLVRSPGRVGFVATSPELYGVWPANSRVAPGGVLDRALHHAAYNVRDTFAWGRPGAQPLWCSTRLVHSGLAVAVMSTRRVHRADHDPTPAEVTPVIPALVRQPDADLDDPVPAGELLHDALKQPASAAVGHSAPRDPPTVAAPVRQRLPVSLEQVRAALRPRSLTVLASRPSHGKSALALGLATDMAWTHGTRVALACTELSVNEVALRLMAATANVDLQRLRTGRLDDSDWDRLTRSLGGLADLNVTLIAVSQLRRRAEERGNQPPELTDLPEYRAAIHVADLIGLLHTRGPMRPWAQEDSRAAELLVVRHRFGPTGLVDLRFDDQYCRLSDPRTPLRQTTTPAALAQMREDLPAAVPDAPVAEPSEALPDKQRSPDLPTRPPSGPSDLGSTPVRARPSLRVGRGSGSRPRRLA